MLKDLLNKLLCFHKWRAAKGGFIEGATLHWDGKLTPQYVFIFECAKCRKRKWERRIMPRAWENRYGKTASDGWPLSADGARLPIVGDSRTIKAKWRDLGSV